MYVAGRMAVSGSCGWLRVVQWTPAENGEKGEGGGRKGGGREMQTVMDVRCVFEVGRLRGKKTIRWKGREERSRGSCLLGLMVTGFNVCIALCPPQEDLCDCCVGVTFCFFSLGPLLRCEGENA